MTYVKQGSMKVTLFDNERRIISEFILNQGDLAIYAYGGHGYEILSDDTQIIEAKNGPFIGVDEDKEKFWGLQWILYHKWNPVLMKMR